MQYRTAHIEQNRARGIGEVWSGQEGTTEIPTHPPLLAPMSNASPHDGGGIFTHRNLLP